MPVAQPTKELLFSRGQIVRKRVRRTRLIDHPRLVPKQRWLVHHQGLQVRLTCACLAEEGQAPTVDVAPIADLRLSHPRGFHPDGRTQSRYDTPIPPGFAFQKSQSATPIPLLESPRKRFLAQEAHQSITSIRITSSQPILQGRKPQAKAIIEALVPYSPTMIQTVTEAGIDDGQ